MGTNRKGFTIEKFVASCSTCMGKEGLLNTVAVAPPKEHEPEQKEEELSA